MLTRSRPTRAAATGCGETIRRTAAGGDPRNVWRSWSPNGEAKLHGLDTAFASKIAYFACFDGAHNRGPLIADNNTTWAMWVLSDHWGKRDSADRYRDYLEWAQHWASRLKCRSDDIERALFLIGPKVKKMTNSGRA